jgi:hypothetical protein
MELSGENGVWTLATLGLGLGRTWVGSGADSAWIREFPVFAGGMQFEFHLGHA